MTEPNSDSVRRELLAKLMEKANADTYPSVTMLNMIESMLRPDEVPAYTEMLFAKIRDDQFPSIPTLQRIAKFAR